MKGLITATKPPRTCIALHDCSSRHVFKICFTVTIFNQRILTTLTSNHYVACRWIADVIWDTQSTLVGLEFEFDVKTTNIATLQLCVENRCLVLQLDHALPLPTFFEDFLGDKRNLFIGTHIKSKIDKFRGQFSIQARANTRDLFDKLACMRELKQTEMDSIALSIGKVDSDWDRMPYVLSVRQVHYACIDAFLNLHIWKSLLSSFRLPPENFDEATSITPYPEVVGANKDCYDVVVLGETIFTTVPKHPDAVKEWIDGVIKTFQIGFAIEYDDTQANPRVGTLQLCDGTRCLVLQLLNVQPLPLALRQFLADQKYIFVGSDNVKEDIKLFKRQYPFKGKVNCMEGFSSSDTRQSTLWKKCRLGDVWLLELDWHRRTELSHKQVHYACMDAFLNLHIAKNGGQIK